MKAEIYFDGLCLPVNPGGIGCYGFVIRTKEGDIRECGVIGKNSTNNIAEYTALIKALERALELGVNRAVVKGDSQLAIRQMTGVYGVHSENIFPLWKKAKALSKKFKEINFVWIPRSQNSEADALSTKAYVEYQERGARERAMEIKENEIKKISDTSFKVRGYNVDLKKGTCDCPFFKRMNSYRLHKRSGIKIRCKHIFAAELSK
ncbi:MAG: ribonuclease HI [Candidatus Methanospirareceae archaeon]